VVLEVNTGGMARYGAESPYPARWQLEVWHEMGGDVILSSDCHFAPDLLSHYNDAVELLLKIGYKKVRVLGTDKDMFEETKLEPIQL
jgi:histidinol-phosphatase (PHP family)